MGQDLVGVSALEQRVLSFGFWGLSSGFRVDGLRLRIEGSRCWD
jgi:hypothetical protein